MGMWLTTLLSTWWARITRSRTTVTFLLFVLANYAAQTILHAVILSGYTRDGDLVTRAINAAGVRRGFAVIQHDMLKICYGIPTVHSTKCHTVCSFSANSTAININTPSASVRCAEGLIWLENYLRTSKSEGIVYLVFQSWLAVISFIALLNESIPHLIVTLVAQVVNTSWISYRVVNDPSVKRIYDEIIVVGTCGHFDILGGSWQHSNYYVALGFSTAALLGMAFFVFKLVKLYSTATLSSVGSSPVINRLLKWRLWMRMFILFSAFFILTSAAVWFCERKRDMIAEYSRNTLYDAGFYAVVVMLLPWMTLGAHSITVEKRLLFFIYALLSICLLLISSLWFGSTLFRYEYGAWGFFTCVTTLADVLLVITCIVSVVCRANFGKGLADFLNVERALRTSGFARDTFVCDPSRPDNVERSFTFNNPALQSDLLSDPSFSSSHHSYQSVCSIGSAANVYTAWLSSQGGRDQEKGRQKVNTGGRLGSTVTISWEDMRPHSVQSTNSGDENDSGDDEEKKAPTLNWI